MIQAGDTLANPVTKERMTFLKTAAETNGEYVLIELSAAPGAVVAAAHVHPSQTETFEVVSGTLAADGKTSKKGMPNPLRLAVIANHHLDDVQLPVVPRWLQQAALALGAPLGRLLGYTPQYVPTGVPVSAPTS